MSIEIWTNEFSTMKVSQKGKGFVTETNYPATRNSEAETIVKSHRAYSGVEKLIKKRCYKRVDNQEVVIGA